MINASLWDFIWSSFPAVFLLRGRDANSQDSNSKVKVETTESHFVEKENVPDQFIETVWYILCLSLYFASVEWEKTSRLSFFSLLFLKYNFAVSISSFLEA